MGFLECSLCCHNTQDQPEQPHSNNNNLQSESSNSTSASLSSQPSLPSVPSLSIQHQHTPHQNHKLLTTIKGHTSSITSLALHTKFLYTGSSNSQIRRCFKDPFALQSSNNNNNNVVATITNGSTIKSMLIHNHMLFTSHQDHKIRVWNIQPNPNPNPKFIKCIATLPTFNDRFSKLFSSKNYVEIRRHKKCTWVNHVDTVSCLALSKDGSLLYSASWDRTFKIWRISDFKCLESVKDAHEDAINAIAVSSDGTVYTGSADRKIKIWRKNEKTNKHSLVGTLEKHKSAVNAVALNEDGSVLYSGACDRSILVWEKNNNNNNNGDFDMVLVGALRGHSKAILCLVVKGDLVCSGSADYSVRVWRRGFDHKKGYSCLAVLVGHTRPVKCLAMAEEQESNNGGNNHTGSTSYLVYSGSLDCDIKVWQISVPFL